MKIKELQKTVNIAWSPAQLNPLYLAAGTAAQQIDTSLNSNATLEVYEIDLTDPGYDLVLKATQTSPYSFQKIVWSPLRSTSNSCGVIAAGCESGHLQLYSASKLLGGEDALIASQDKHTGAVRALDYNPFQSNLLASGASESDIFIWDLNNTTTPMTPGTKTQPLEDIQNIAWNRQVQHILASVFSTRCVVWDLRKNEPIIKLSDTQSRVRFRALQWHPNIATQLWLASEEDSAPVAQLWDLRYATAPAKTLRIHERGILGLTWCPKDTDLMVSCGKDNKILCWNPNEEHQGDEILSEIASTIQWYSDVTWCPRNPALIASSSLDGAVSIYSLYGGTQQQVQTSNKIADSFPGMDTFAQAPAPQATTQVVYSDLRKPPKWMKQSIGAKFGFGGKLITFRNENSATRNVTLSQVITEPELIERSTKLEEVLANGNFTDYCRQRADETQDQHNRYVWYFLKANFEQDPRSEMLNLLGYNAEDIQTKFNKIIEKNADNDIDAINNKLADIGRNDSSDIEGDYIGSTSSTTNDSNLSTTDNAAVFDSIGEQQKLNNELDDGNDEIPYKIRTGEDNEGLICEALLTGNIEAAVELCMESNRTADAIIIATTGGSELLARTQYRYLKKSQGYLSNIISALVTADWTSVITQCTTDSWKEALVATLTHCREHVPLLCERLGERLQIEGGNNLSSVQSAILCYICAGNAERLAETWLATHSQAVNAENVATQLPSTKELIDLIEVVVLFQKALEMQGRNVSASGKLANLLTQYASLLAAQGALSSALTYLGPSENQDIVELRERLYYSLGHKQAYTSNVRSQSQAQNYYANTQTPNKFMQPRTSIGSVQQPTLPFSAGFNNAISSTNAPIGASSPPQPWNNPVPTHPQSHAWNSTPFGQSAATNSMLPPVQTKSIIGQPPLAAANEPLHPPRPSSVSSQGSAPVTRSKYILDPSVQSSSAYGQTANMYAPPQSNAPFISQQQSYGVTQPSSLQNYNQYNPQPFNPAPIGNVVGQPSILNPPIALNNFAPGVPPIELAQPAMPQHPIQRNPTPPPGWNDPPAIKSNRSVTKHSETYLANTNHSQQQPYSLGQSLIHYGNMSAVHAGTKKWNKIISAHQLKGQQLQQQHAQSKTTASNENLMKTISQASTTVPDTTTSSNVITHPLFVTDPNQNYGQNGYAETPASIGYQGSFMTQQLSPQQHQSHPPTLPPSVNQQTSFQTQLPNAQQPQFPSIQQQTQPTAQRQAPTPDLVKPKAPLPEEYMYLQTVFNELRTQCSITATNPQIKRKLEDVTKRLECLYDLLRDNRLGPNTLASLNQLVQLVQIGDYANGLGLHTQMVSGPDFAQIASFMPGIKVLLQTAMQLQVYLR